MDPRRHNRPQPPTKVKPPPRQEAIEDPPPPYSLEPPVTTAQQSRQQQEEYRSPPQAPQTSTSQAPLQPLQPQEIEAESTKAPLMARLPKPVAIPAITYRTGSAFLRAYPPALKELGLSQADFLRFLDDINEVVVNSPPLQVLGHSNHTIALVPSYYAQKKHPTVHANKSPCTLPVTEAKTELALHDANKDIFMPRGLKVEISQMDALAKITGMPVLHSSGKIDRRIPLLQPIEDLTAIDSVTSQERRLRAIAPWIADLEIMPESELELDPQGTSFVKASSKKSGSQEARDEKRVQLDRRRVYTNVEQKMAKIYDDNLARLDKKIEKLHLERKKTKSTSRRLDKIESSRSKLAKFYDERKSKANDERLKRRMRFDTEEKHIRRILWLVIRNDDNESDIGLSPSTTVALDDNIQPNTTAATVEGGEPLPRVELHELEARSVGTRPRHIHRQQRTREAEDSDSSSSSSSSSSVISLGSSSDFSSG